LEKKSYGGIAGAVTEFSRKVSSKIFKEKTGVISIYESRDNLSNTYDIYQTPGWRAIEHLYALRIYFRKGSLLDEKNKEQPNRFGEPSGNIVNMTIAKTKVCKPDRKLGQYTLNYTNGIDVLSDTIDMTIKYDFIVQAGAWFQVIDNTTVEILTHINGDELKFQGRAKLAHFLGDDHIYYELSNAVMERLMNE